MRQSIPFQPLPDRKGNLRAVDQPARGSRKTGGRITAGGVVSMHLFRLAD